MCGIAGIATFGTGEGRVDEQSLQSLKASLQHRGPDGARTWSSDDRTVGLVHTRLAIIDLTDTGVQPMASPDGRFHIVFNGEIYNYVELRAELESEGERFVGTSDTEVLLRLVMRRGTRCLSQLDGMFAFAIFDSRERSIFFARDPLGEKPLYYVRGPHRLAFSSEVRALVGAGLSSGAADLEALGFFLRQGSIPAPLTHIRDVRLLEPGSYARLDLSRGDFRIERYWSIPYADEREAITDREAAFVQVESVLRESVRRRLRSDVPMGVFLSRGVDSTAVAALMQEAGARRLRTFTVSLPGQENDEGAAARRIAEHLGTEHTEIPLQLSAESRWLDSALDAMDVPSVDGPNTYLVSRAVRESGCKVACSGLGGDELFFGYPSFDVVPRAMRYAGPFAPLRAMRAPARAVMQHLPRVPRVGRVADAVLAGGSPAAMWLAKRGLFSESEVRGVLSPEAYVHASRSDAIGRIESLPQPHDLSPKRMVGFYELSVYLHDQLLRDSDVMSMAHALEVRVPLIARPVVDTVAQMSASVLDGSTKKWMLRRIVGRRMPEAMFDTPKQGFTLNWRDILRHFPMPTNTTAAGLLRSDAMQREREALLRGRVGFARYFALVVVDRLFARPYATAR